MQYHPPSGSTDPNAPYVGKNVAAGILGSKVPPGAAEMPQREIVGVIGNSGQTPTDTDPFQLTRAVRGGQLDFAADTGTADALVVSFSLAHTAIKAGLPIVVFKGGSANATTTPKLTLQGPGGANPLTQTIVKANGQPLAAGDLPAGAILALRSDGTSFRLLSLLTTSDVVALVSANGAVHYGATNVSDTTATTLSVTVAPAVTGYSGGAVYAVLMRQPANGATTLNVNGLGARPVVKANGQAIQVGDWTAFQIVLLVDDFNNLRVVGLLPSDVLALTGNSLVHYGSTSTADQTATTLTATVAPAVAGYSAGAVYAVLMAQPANGATTLNLNGLGARPVVKANGQPIQVGDWVAYQIVILVDDNYRLRVVGLLPSDVLALISANAILHNGVAAGSAAVLTATVTPAITAYAYGAAYEINMPAAAVSGGTTLALNGLVPRAVLRQDGQPIQAGDWGAGEQVLLFDDGQHYKVSGLRTAALPTANMVAFATPGTYSFTVPFGIFNIKRFRIWGAGGGSGGAYNGACASGAGGGGYSEGTLAVTPGQVLTVVVGAGGAAGTAAPSAGTNGGASLISGVAQCNGGQGSAGVNATVDGTSNAGGTASGGQINIIGGYSGGGYFAGSFPCGGAGGGSFGASATPVGLKASPYYPGGGAGGGSCSSGTGQSSPGAPGANGLVILEY